MLFQAAYSIIREAVDKILGEVPSQEIVGRVKEIVESEMGGHSYLHHFHIHNYGDHTEFTFHIKVPGTETVLNAHTLATNVEERIKNELNMEATIHIEPLLV